MIPFRHTIRVIILWLFANTAYGYNIDSLITSISTWSLNEQHKKVDKEINRLKETSPEDALELANYWVGVLNDNHDSKNLAPTLLNIANIYYRLGNYALNIQYCQTSRNLYKTIGDVNGEARAIREIGFTYRKMGQYQEAYQYLDMSAIIFKKNKNACDLAVNYNYMGNLIEEWKNDLVVAEELYRNSYHNAITCGDKQGQSYSLEFIGIIKSKQGFKDSSLSYFNRSLELRKELNLSLPIALSYTNMAEVMDMHGDVKGAQEYYQKALDISAAIKFHDLTNFLYGNLSKVHKKRGNLEAAITYMEMQQALKDSLFNLQKTKEFAEIKEKYESELKEEKIRTLNNELALDAEKRKKQIYLYSSIIAALVVLVLTGVVVAIAIYNREQKRLALEKINAERVRNKMIIEAEEKERTRIAKDLHDSVGQMLAALKMNLNSITTNKQDDQYTKTTQILDDTIVEMRSISHAMMPESLIKNGLAQALIDITGHLNTASTTVTVNVENWKGWSRTGEYVLYRVVQELLNNTLKHAQAKQVVIELNQFADEINLIYEDDGKGVNLDEVKSDGIGLKNMMNRISSINGHIEFDSHPGGGFTAIIAIPLKQEQV